MDVYFFDCDKTLYDYDFHMRLPRLAELGGVSQYRLASTWWAGGHERAAEIGEYATSEEYLAAFAEVTGAHLTLAQWQDARKAAMTPIEGSIAALHTAATLGTVSLLSNNPIPFKDSLPVLTPEIVDVLRDNDLVSAVLGARKPERRIYTRALGRFGVQPGDAILFDDSLANVDGAREAGMHAHHFIRNADGSFDTDGMLAAIHAFAERER
ncbi:HAD-IA family hydrolase [Leifsonia sp. TF02-11]|uniref:HAD-IA family hydrolase n=1 Tax=Leifsonia sp. TF02-11 TaxID=2815212 RepID=UPI001AA0B1D6|nr:HAD-IA family hydrolase [Leifsonia sp. TF02-11]MBO1741675.1 HAD-IA family hydrolase [Leifsonia sp. TF02-11]